MDTCKIGFEKEEKIFDYLKSRKWNVLARNYRCRFGEIDLIAEERLKNGLIELVFIEVRYLKKAYFFSPFESVRVQKQRRIQKVAQLFLQKYSGLASTLRFDVIAWEGSRITHFRHAW